MKFVIDWNGKLFIDHVQHPSVQCEQPTFKEMEEILQAVKKTQAKLVNKQIQEIQDSKNQSINTFA